MHKSEVSEAEGSLMGSRLSTDPTLPRLMTLRAKGYSGSAAKMQCILTAMGNSEYDRILSQHDLGPRQVN